MSLQGESIGVWLSSDLVFSTGAAAPLSACASGGCAPIVSSEACAPPACPGTGFVHRVGRSIADVSDWPSDVDGYQREHEQLLADPVFAGFGLSNHPDYAEWQRRHQREERARRREERRHEEDVRWVSRHREDGERFELSLNGDVATLTETPGTYLGATAGVGLLYYADANDAEDEEDDFVLNFFVGDTVGLEMRAHFLYRVDTAQEAEWIAAVGLSSVFANRFSESIVRIPTYIGTALPEVGLMLRSDRSPTWYVAWDVPFSFLVDHDLAIDLNARVFVVDEWIELPSDAPEGTEDPAEVILMLSAGFRLP